jgi:hypothetical protein
MKSSTVIACTVFVAAVLVGMTHGSYKCWSCNSGSNPLECKETFGPTTIAVEKKDNCTCCKKEKSNDVWTRGCGSIVECVQVSNSWSCWGDLCNAAAPMKVQGIIFALIAALGLAAYMRY